MKQTIMKSYSEILFIFLATAITLILGYTAPIHIMQLEHRANSQPARFVNKG
jgi:uncharacterized membrane protein